MTTGLSPFLAEIADKMPSLFELFVINLCAAAVVFCIALIHRKFVFLLIPLVIWWIYLWVDHFFLDRTFSEAVVWELGRLYQFVAVVASCIPLLVLPIAWFVRGEVSNT